MNLKAGTRLKGVRELLGLTTQEFADLMGISWVRLRNIEQLKARVAEDEFAWVALNIPPLLLWVACEGDISLDELKASDKNLCRGIAGRIEAGLVPQGYFFEEKIK